LKAVAPAAAVPSWGVLAALALLALAAFHAVHAVLARALRPTASPA
jgi:hypothetical protein